MSDLPGFHTLRNFHWHDVLKIVLALAIGAVGGAVFYYWRMPLAWMIGAMTVTTVASLAGAPLRNPGRLRGVMITVIGIMLGSAFTPDTIERAVTWMPSLVGVMLYALVLVVTGFLYLRNKPEYDPVSAYFSATPGGFTEMTLIGGAMGGDERTISLTHSMRVLVVVLVIPFWFRFFYGYVPNGTVAFGMAADVSLADAAILILCAAIGFALASRLRIPAPALSGPMLLSAAVHLSGITQAHPPAELIALAQIIIGTSIGCRFIGIAVKRVFRTMMRGAVTTLIMLAVGGVFAYVLEAITGLPVAALLLAFSPGGLPEMSLISLAMGIDIAFVSTHHLVRIIFIVVLAPVIFRIFQVQLTGAPAARSPGK